MAEADQDDQATSGEVTDDQVDQLVEDERVEIEAAGTTADEGAEEKPAAPAAPAGLTKEQVEEWVQGALEKAQPAPIAPVQAPPQEPDDDADMPVTRGEMAALQRRMAADQQMTQLKAELQAAQAQFASDLAPETQEDLYWSAVRSLQNNPGQTVAAAYKTAADREQTKISHEADRKLQKRIDKAAERKLARGEPVGAGSGAPAAVSELPKGFDPSNNDDVSALADKILAQMPSTPGAT